MHRRLLYAIVLLIPAPVIAEDVGRAEFFEQRIRPTLVTRCYRCHGPDKSSNGLRVDSREHLMKGGEHGPAVDPDKVLESRLLRAIEGTDSDLSRMPPDKPLDAAVIADFKAWIGDGSFWPESASTRKAFAAQRHWAYLPVQESPPEGINNPWSVHPVDHWIEIARRKRNLSPVADADAKTLTRRLSFDLTGLPPDPEEVQQFQQAYQGTTDQREAALAREIDRLLDSPRYGERWGRHWMDVVRYADTAGDNADYPIPEVIQYRDYIIDSFNRDKPYDQFVREQLAGDLMPDPNSEQITAERIKATGFLALSRRYATGPYELWHLTLEDTIDTVGKAFLGLTMKCARCHDHKFDPITTRDYYALYGIFDSTQFPWAGAEEFHSKQTPRIHFVPLSQRDRIPEILATHSATVKSLTDRMTSLQLSIPETPPADREKMKAEISELDRQLKVAKRRGYPQEIEIAYAVREGQPHDVAVQKAGDPAQLGDLVPRGAIAFLTNEPLQIPANSSGRLQLAEWITSSQNPLTARVIVNRIWQHHFGRGIVATSSNFGVSGALPTHPELLDFLAGQLIKNNWSLKSIHRMILTSRTWRLSSNSDDEMAAIDTGNEYLWRQNRRRLDAEAIRDAFLAVSGRLDLARPGTHPFPGIEHWNWTQHNPFQARYESNHRSVYQMTQRLQRHPFLSLYDGPDTNTTTDVRTSATVPIQSLYLLNGPEMTSIADSLAKRLTVERPDNSARIARLFDLCFSRPPTEEEKNRGLEYLQMAESRLADRALADQLAWRSYARMMLVSNEFFYVD